MVYVTLTTIPSRLHSEDPSNIISCINSLANQDYPDYEIHFNIPSIYKKLDVEYIIPDWLKEIEKVKIFRTEDRGPLTKLLETVNRVHDPEAIIIVADDDLVYDPRMVSEQVNNQAKWPECAVGYDGMRSRDEKGNYGRHFGDIRDYYFTSNYRSSRVDVLQHYKTVSYKRRFFEEDFNDFINDNYSWSDDILIAAYLSYKKRDRIATFHTDDEEFTSRQEWEERGGVTTFPVLQHTSHESYEGCNISRQTGEPDNSSDLYRFIDAGYKKEIKENDDTDE